jgi:hypothetical protein
MTGRPQALGATSLSQAGGDAPAAAGGGDADAAPGDAALDDAGAGVAGGTGKPWGPPLPGDGAG